MSDQGNRYWKRQSVAGQVARLAREAAEKDAEIKRLCDELGYIANAEFKNFTDGDEFRTWAQNRARHALGIQPGELKIKK